MYIIRKKFKFEMAHQLVDAYSKACSDQIHGHSYICEVFFSSQKLDNTGMVVDFTQIKDKIKPYIDSWDHALVMSADMPIEYLDCLIKYNKNLKIVKYNPTAENMAKDIFEYIEQQMPNCLKVRLHETDTGYAEYYKDLEDFGEEMYDEDNETIFDPGE
jgi:6-pyruvoyltetrahydropterin/6-carboxytetrahydropterin synthase